MSLVSGSNSAFSSSIFFLLVFVLDVEALLGGALKLLTIKLFELLHRVLIDWIYHIENFEPLLAQGLEKG